MPLLIRGVVIPAGAVHRREVQQRLLTIGCELGSPVTAFRDQQDALQQSSENSGPTVAQDTKATVNLSN